MVQTVGSKKPTMHNPPVDLPAIRRDWGIIGASLRSPAMRDQREPQGSSI